MLELEARAEPSRLMSWASPLLAVVLMLVGGLVVFAALGKDPVEGFRVFFLNPVKDLYALSELLLKATPLMLCAIGLAIGFRANVWNIGAEGQFMLGAVAATGVALYFGDSESALVLPAMVLAGAAGGAAWAAIPALLRTRFNANEILVSLMLVYVAQLFVSWLVFGPWKDPDGFNFPQTRMFAEAATLPMVIEGTRLHLGFAIALAALVAGYAFMNRSHAGFRMRVAGEAAGRRALRRLLGRAHDLAGPAAGRRRRRAGRHGRGRRADGPAHRQGRQRLRLRRDHRRLRRPPQRLRHPARQPADGPALHRRRAGAAIPQPAQLDLDGVPGHVALLPARRRTSSSTTACACAGAAA